MTTTYEHLSPKTAEAVEGTIEERIRYVNTKRWIHYPQAKIALDRMRWLLESPPSPRMPNMLIIGESNNGKSHLLKQFYKMYPADAGRGQNGSVVPVMFFEMPASPDESRIYDEILSLLHAPFRYNDKVSKKQDLTGYYLQMVGNRLMMIDEFHHINNATPKKQRECLNAIKLLGTQNQIPIVAAGVKEVMNAIGSDAQLSNRFEPYILPRWTMSGEFQQLLASFEKTLPLREPSYISADKMAQKILTLTEGLIGEMAILLTRATEIALRDGREKLSLSDIEQAVWATPSERKRVLERWH